jgi:hypothetical protein
VPVTARPLGLIAGAGRYPLEVIRGARAQGRTTAVVALDRVAVAAVEQEATCALRCRVGRIAAAAAFLVGAGATEVVLAGGVPWRLAAVRPWPDRHALALVPATLFGDGPLLGALAATLGRLGLEVVAPGPLVAHLACPAGLVAGPPLDGDARRLAAIALDAARRCGRRERGQAAVATPRHVLLEGRSGTDALLRRARRAGAGGVLAKIAKPGQDRRFDLPAIGPETVAAARRAGLRAIVVEAGSTLLLDRAEVAALCDAGGVSLEGRAVATAS